MLEFWMLGTTSPTRLLVGGDGGLFSSPASKSKPPNHNQGYKLGAGDIRTGRGVKACSSGAGAWGELEAYQSWDWRRGSSKGSGVLWVQWAWKLGGGSSGMMGKELTLQSLAQDQISWRHWACTAGSRLVQITGSGSGSCWGGFQGHNNWSDWQRKSQHLDRARGGKKKERKKRKEEGGLTNTPLLEAVELVTSAVAPGVGIFAGGASKEAGKTALPNHWQRIGR
ncbi:hypothetical protein BY996DRAFT_6536520 [Phakopsora pachyrhizi]|nr:hypothetical protein BY996DRAFT_6536520 [Phakopsora pachyrhizi]